MNATDISAHVEDAIAYLNYCGIKTTKNGNSIKTDRCNILYQEDAIVVVRLVRNEYAYGEYSVHRMIGHHYPELEQLHEAWKGLRFQPPGYRPSSPDRKYRD